MLHISVLGSHRFLLLATAALGLAVLVAGCSLSGSAPEPTATSVVEQPTASPTATPTEPAATATSQAPTAEAPTVEAPVVSAPEPTFTPLPTELFLELASPQDESVVTTDSVTVSGVTTPDAVVSVNGEPVEVNALGEFSVAAVLIEGPNLIEVVASDLSSQKRAEIAVIYLPL